MKLSLRFPCDLPSRSEQKHRIKIPTHDKFQINSPVLPLQNEQGWTRLGTCLTQWMEACQELERFRPLTRSCTTIVAYFCPRQPARRLRTTTSHYMRTRNLMCACRSPLLLTARVGKVSGIEVSGRVSGMPEMPGTKPGFGRPKLPETAQNYKS